jgi:hypothetical protein
VRASDENIHMSHVSLVLLQVPREPSESGSAAGIHVNQVSLVLLQGST